ncbi:MAG: hypothetical protein ACLSGI_09755 [Butyricicoccaceae bacterium]
MFSVLEDCGAIPVDKLKGKRIGRLYALLVVVLSLRCFVRTHWRRPAQCMPRCSLAWVCTGWAAAVWAKFTPALH